MERQAPRDAVVLYNAEGLSGLYDRPKPGRRERLTKLRSIFSASAISAIERHFLASGIRFHRCGRASARIIVSSKQAFGGAHASLPPGAMITFYPPRRFHVIRLLGRKEFVA